MIPRNDPRTTTRKPPVRDASGFTYLEVLIALAILLGLSVAVSMSLGRVLGAEAEAVSIQDGSLELRRLSARRLGGQPGEVLPGDGATWTVEPAPDLEAAGWELWRVEAAGRPSLGFPVGVIATGRAE